MFVPAGRVSECTQVGLVTKCDKISWLWVNTPVMSSAVNTTENTPRF